MNIRYYNTSDKAAWDAYVQDHPKSTNCHLSGWKDVIEETYGHRTHYLLAEDGSKMVGLLPLVQVKSCLFGNNLVSMPFLNYGGILADNEEGEKALLSEAIELSKKLKVTNLELRHLYPLGFDPSALSSHDVFSSPHAKDSLGARRKALIEEEVECPAALTPSRSHDSFVSPQASSEAVLRPPADISSPHASRLTPHASIKTNKVRMLLELPDSSAELFMSFKAKLRSQINRPMKEGMETLTGGSELLEDFYRIFAINMRDLGSPVHSKSLFRNVLDQLGGRARIIAVRHQGQSVAGALIICFRDTVEVPWASSLRKYNALSPNMLLYWSLLKFACDHGHKFFDFGRSTPGEGTEKFKAQWGANPQPLYWYSIVPGSEKKPQAELGSWEVRTLGENVWRRFPVCLANLVGPRLRGGIPL
jgi:serine/alanine adding enzyme